MERRERKGDQIGEETMSRRSSSSRGRSRSKRTGSWSWRVGASGTGTGTGTCGDEDKEGDRGGAQGGAHSREKKKCF